MLWEVDIYPAPGQPNQLGQQVAVTAVELGFAGISGSSPREDT